MAKENPSVVAEKQTEQSTLILTQEKKEERIICEVCGHANPHDTAICKMCSNYLEGVK